MEQSYGPTRIHAEVQAYLSIGMPGAAYRVLSPHLTEFGQISEISREFAHVATNAGDIAAARNALLPHMTQGDADKQIDEWTRQRLASRSQ